MIPRLEHANVTVTDPDATAAWLVEVFGWHIRWQGPSKDKGRSVHVGTDDSYIALYTRADAVQTGLSSYDTVGMLNHLAVFTDDIDAVEAKVTAAGFTPGNHADYAPGRRFYFHDRDGLEWEVASHQP
ncbi:VOC family protein [Pseudooceanicola nanhaiensis]|uniref:VOC family protein n=1 Tax=Pseudooceanicola nanhaiensis TaxID=375761 RepID=UPI001CD47133|nr:VOC family protein [Pseudooceanicola nanhaiensis]MCA0920620.1 VOC family protein [Pseudooceanicola nanhaiensis]